MAGRPLSEFDLPEGWEETILELYANGGSDEGIRSYIASVRGSMSNDLWYRWMNENVVFCETIKKGRSLRCKISKNSINEVHKFRLNRRKLSRQNEYVGYNKIICSLRSLIFYHTKNISGKFNKRTFDLLGYTKEDYIQNISKKLSDGMTFENYGLWHVDHIIPASWFNMDKEDQLRKCWSLSNLEPKWAFDNISKGNRRIG